MCRTEARLGRVLSTGGERARGEINLWWMPMMCEERDICFSPGRSSQSATRVALDVHVYVYVCTDGIEVEEKREARGREEVNEGGRRMCRIRQYRSSVV